jgi:arylformamidase
MSHRAVVSFVATFTNGGHIAADDFRVDVDGSDATEGDIAEALIATLGLTMVDAVNFSHVAIVEEAHRSARPGANRGSSADVATRRHIVDLSHQIDEGMTTYPGVPGPEFADHLSREQAKAVYAPGVTFHIGRISMVANTGTYIDSPFHRFSDAPDLAGLRMEQLADLEGVVVRLTGSNRRGVEVSELAPFDVAGKAVLLHTGWDHHWGTAAYGVDATFVSAGATQWLVDHGAALVGIDSVNIDDMGDPARPAHSGLLQAGIPIVEHLRGLEQLPVTGFRFHAAPPAVANFGTFPVRAYAVIGA